MRSRTIQIRTMKLMIGEEIFLKTQIQIQKQTRTWIQDNICYRSPECQQANDAQQIEGNDNEATGFNDQSKNFDIEAIPTSTTAGSGAVGPAGPQVQQVPVKMAQWY